MKHRSYRFRRFSLIIKLISALVAVAVAAIATDLKLRPAIIDLALVEANSIASSTLHTAVEKIIIENAPDYSELVEIIYNENGVITAVTGNTVKMNLFKTQITNAVDSAFAANPNALIIVPAGSASGITLFSGVGPDIKVKASFSSTSKSDFENEFTSVGINQTQHRVMLRVSATVLITLSGKRVISSAETSFCVAQTVLVGSVPDIVFN